MSKFTYVKIQYTNEEEVPDEKFEKKLIKLIQKQTGLPLQSTAWLERLTPGSNCPPGGQLRFWNEPKEENDEEDDKTKRYSSFG